jgi:hypothetical protein
MDERGNRLQNLYIDPTTGAVLKNEIFDFAGTSLGSYEFKSINFVGRINPRRFEFNRKGAKIVSPEMLAREIAAKNDLPAEILPKASGFELESVRMIAPEGKNVLLYMYTSRDGRLSVFQTRSDIERSRLERIGRQEISSRTWRVGRVTYVVVGPKGEKTERAASMLERQTKRN